MRRLIYYGYSVDSGEFILRIVETYPGGDRNEVFLSLSRADCNKISKHMQFGKKGEERVIETVNGEVVK